MEIGEICGAASGGCQGAPHTPRPTAAKPLLHADSEALPIFQPDQRDTGAQDVPASIAKRDENGRAHKRIPPAGRSITATF